ncbi:MAG TPA: hypothetical protein VIG25_02780 [Pyrinomonadaceae bacterium]|jgi:hypothetical protein
MNGRFAGVGMPILFGAYLLYSQLPKSQLYEEGPQAKLASVLAGLGAFLLVLGLVFLWRNLK